jgi:hypothetical protein
MSPGVVLPVTVAVKNTGDWPWPDAKTANPPNPDGSCAVRLSYRWATSDGELLLANAERGDLSAPVLPGALANITIKITPPAPVGAYQLQFDLVEELVTFFSTRGIEKLIISVTVR